MSDKKNKLDDEDLEKVTGGKTDKIDNQENLLSQTGEDEQGTGTGTQFNMGAFVRP